MMLKTEFMANPGSCSCDECEHAGLRIKASYRIYAFGHMRDLCHAHMDTFLGDCEQVVKQAQAKS